MNLFEQSVLFCRQQCTEQCAEQSNELSKLDERLSRQMSSSEETEQMYKCLLNLITCISNIQPTDTQQFATLADCMANIKDVSQMVCAELTLNMSLKWYVLN